MPQKPPRYDEFMRFLASDPDRHYDSTSCALCAMALFLGRRCENEDEYAILGGRTNSRQQIFRSPETFGALAERLEKLDNPWTEL